MDLRKVDVLDIVGGVVVADLTASPVHAFNLHSFPGFDGTVRRVVWMPSVLWAMS